ncbi:hypothetical protein BW154_04750 [Lactococcus lactis]|uniref:Phage protein n=1 Tax=Lactococcus lactis TaxID=1358 RepID=A0AAP8E0T8_9LACT|nr:hypothetical protein [Lactococcus lactis]PFG88807.1 hypothetical protein BW154_04750 [Lactococcus lactis]
MKARKKPVVVDVVRFYLNNPESINEAKDFAGKYFADYQEHYASDKRNYYIRTLEGEMKLTDGDYIIKGVNGEFYPCKPDIFEATYEIVEKTGDIKIGNVSVKNIKVGKLNTGYTELNI